MNLKAAVQLYLCVLLPLSTAFNVQPSSRWSDAKPGRATSFSRRLTTASARVPKEETAFSGTGQRALETEKLEELRQKLWNPSIRVDWEAFYRTVQTEKSYMATDIEGEIPRDFAASIFRNGPGRFDRGGTRYQHVLDGDGHIIKFVVDGKTQRAHISNRYVRTDEFAVEEQADEILYRSTFGTQSPGLKNNVLNLMLKNQANTNIQFLGGPPRLLALWEAGLPYRINPWTLETEGADLLEGCVSGQPGALTVTTGVKAVDELLKLGRAFTAHPHRDSVTGRMVGWSWAQNPLTSSLSMTLVEWDEETQEEVLRSEYMLEECSMAPHDFAVTESYYVFVVNQLEIDLLPYVAGIKGPAQCLSCTGKGNVVHLVPRPGGPAAGTKPIVIKTDDPWFVIHLSNAFEQTTGHIVAFCTGWDKVTQGPFLSDWGGDVPLYEDVPTTFLFRLEVDVAAGTGRNRKT